MDNAGIALTLLFGTWVIVTSIVALVLVRVQKVRDDLERGLGTDYE